MTLPTLPRIVPAGLLAGALVSSILLLVTPAQRAGEPVPPLAPAPWTGWLVLFAAVLLLVGLVWPVARRRARMAITTLAGLVLATVLVLVTVAPSEGQPYAVLHAAAALGFTVVGLAAAVPLKLRARHTAE